MLSFAQAVERRGSSGAPLPTVYQSLAQAGAEVCKGQVTLVAGPASGGKSLLVFNLLLKMKVPTLAFILDADALTASARMAAIVTADDFLKIRDDIDAYRPVLAERTDHVRAHFFASEKEDLELQLKAYEQRYGLPPELLVLDNIGNMSGSYENEWQIIKAMILELDRLAKENQMAVIATAHMTDIETTTPLPRSKLLGKGSQFPRVILSCAVDPYNGELKVAVVKASAGPSDISALHPITFYIDAGKMQVNEYKAPPQQGWGGY